RWGSSSDRLSSHHAGAVDRKTTAQPRSALSRPTVRDYDDRSVSTYVIVAVPLIEVPRTPHCQSMVARSTSNRVFKSVRNESSESGRGGVASPDIRWLKLGSI